MDAFLDFLGLYRSDVAKDGSCLFRVVSEQVRFMNNNIDYFSEFFLIILALL